MKTMKFRLLATMITLAAVITATTTPATAQRRSTSSEKSRNERVLKSNSSSKKSKDRKNNIKINDSRSRSAEKTIRKSNQVKRNPTPAVAQKRNETSSKNRSNRTTKVDNQSGRKISGTTNKNRRTNEGSSTYQSNRNSNRSSASSIANNRNSSNDRRSESVSGGARNRSSNVERTDPGNNRSARNGDLNRTNREKYRLDENDRRYTPNRNYHGSNSYWTGRDRPGKMNYNHENKRFFRTYDYVHYKHWDRRWENYRWNFSSWRDYYRGYNPYSYRYHKYYYHHPFYGNVIRRFINPPLVFVHNNINYYCYDGHFFRYHRGIGYILVDMPFGMVFDNIPLDFERVYINGYLYFRVGNLFLEYDNLGYHLIHYPERYFSVNVSFNNNGYIF